MFLMVALDWRHFSLSLSNHFSKIISNILIRAFDVDICPMASFCISSIVLSRSFIGFLIKEISRSRFCLAEKLVLLQFGNPFICDRNKLTTILMIFWQKQYFFLIILYHFIVLIASPCSYFSNCIYIWVGILRVESFKIVCP